MRLTNIVWTTAIVAAASILTAVLSSASLKADNAAGVGPAGAAGKTAQIARGKYLVDIMGCHDCHTPMKLGANGPEWDMSRALSGHPEDAAPLAPVVLPPMPVQNLRALSDSDIRALFAYLQSIPAIKNRNPQPIEAPEAK